jgi:hypothetical protein
MDGTEDPVPPENKMDATAGVPPGSGFGGSPSVATTEMDGTEELVPPENKMDATAGVPPESRFGGSLSVATAEPNVR